MREFFLLLKYDLLRLVRGGKKKTQGAKIAITGVILLIVALSIVGMSALYTALFASILPEDKKHLSLSLIAFVYCLMYLMSTVGTSKILFGANDYDFLSSLPIKSQTVILSKLAYVYIIGLGSSILCFLPASVTYMLVCKSGAITLLNALLLLPFIPLVPLCLGLIIGTLVNILMSKVKRKSIVGIIFSALFLIVYFYFMFGVNEDASDEQMSNMLVNAKLLTPFNLISKGIGGNYLYILLFDLASLLLSFAYVAPLGKYYKKINGIITSKQRGRGVDLSKQTDSSVLKTLLKKEIKVYFSNSAIIMNSIIGPVMAILFGVVFNVKGGVNGLIGADFEGEVDLNEITDMAKIFIPYIPFFFIGISTFAAFSVSLEGKNLWIIKSLPINATDWLNAKLILNLIITLPAGVISVILFGIGCRLLWYDILIAVCIISIYSLLGGLLGLAVNLKFNNFNWTNPAEVVKRGASATICMLVGTFAAIPVIGVQILGSLVSPYLGFALVFIVLSALSYLFYCLAYSKLDKKLLKL